MLARPHIIACSILTGMSFAASHPDLPASTKIAFSVSLFILAIFVAYASLKLYDLPVREWLKKKLFKPAAK